MKRTLAAVLALTASGALAADLTVTWTHPTAFADNSPLTLAQIASTRVEYGTCSGSAFGTASGSVTVPAPAASGVVTVPPGTWCFRAFTRTTAAAGGQESGPSNVAQRVIAFPPPNPPVLSVTIPVAYEINLTGSGLVKLGRDVGSVPVGTSCSEDVIVANNNGTYYSVPSAAVELYRKPRSSVLVAVCKRS
jgi:hypothetical protein